MLNISDPLALLAIEAGQVINPSRQEGAAGTSRLDVPQRSIDFGEAVPIVFGLRRNDKGGILISPGASECRFENDEANAVTAYYLLVLSEGRLDSIPVKDVFQKSCRVGSFTQTYDRRAGSWLPGNFIVQRTDLPLPEATFICGSIGLYPDITTVSFEITIPSGFDQWDRQVHFFIRGGMHVDRLLTEDFGPSDNFADLIQWMLVKANRIPLPLIDVDQLEKTALFLEANGLTCNAWIQQASNYSDLIGSWAPYFLLIASNRGGKKGLRPILPVNQNGTIKTTAVVIEYTFTENLIIPGSFTVEYTNYADRQPFVAQMTWRQELGDEAAIIRTAEIRVPGTAENGPYESYDLSEFCTSEDHAVKVGAYIVADRLFTTHSIRFAPRPELHTTLLSVGSIIRVALTRETASTQPSKHDYLYQIQRISKTFSGETQYECRHFPVDSQRRSIVALNVMNAFGTGILLTTATTGVSCDINDDDDDTIPIEEFVVFNPGTGLDDINVGGVVIGQINSPGFGTGIATGGDDTGISDLENTGDIAGIGDFGDIGGGGATGGFDGTSGGGDGLGGVEANPSDLSDATPLGPMTTEPVPGGDAGVPPSGVCEGGVLVRVIGKIGEMENAITEKGVDWTIPLTPPDGLGLDDGWNGASISFYVECPTGETQYADPIESPPFDPSVYGFARWTGTVWSNGWFAQPATRSSTTGWFNISNGQYLAVRYASSSSAVVPSGTPGPWTSSASYSIRSGLSASSVNGFGLIYYDSSGAIISFINLNSVGYQISSFAGDREFQITSGGWEFSNDQSTIEASWPGNFADGFDPDSPKLP
jgi:hypothetical protein